MSKSQKVSTKTMNVVPTDTQIKSLLDDTDRGVGKQLMVLWCEIKIQNFIDTNRVDRELFTDIYFSKIHPSNYKVGDDWCVNDEKIISRLVNFDRTKHLSHRTKKKTAELVRMVYFMDFWKNNKNDDFVSTFKYIFVDDVKLETHVKSLKIN